MNYSWNYKKKPIPFKITVEKNLRSISPPIKWCIVNILLPKYVVGQEKIIILTTQTSKKLIG